MSCRHVALLGATALVLASPARAQEITVQGEKRAEPAEMTLPAERAREGAGTQGDPVKALQSLPGVGRGGVGGGDLVLWGATPRESRVELDGVEIPALYHGSGVRSVVPAGVIGQVRSVPGAYGVDHGRALGGWVLLSSQPPPTDRMKGRVNVDLLDASTELSVPLPRGDGAARAALRYGYVDRWLPGLMDAELRGLYRVPSYWDAQAELSGRLGADRRARLVFVTSADQRQSDVRAADPARAQHSDERLSFGRLYVRYEQGAASSLTPFIGWDSSATNVAQGSQRSGLETFSVRYGLRAEHHERLSNMLLLRLGLDALGSVTRVERRGSFAVPAREGSPYPFGTPPGTGYAEDSFDVHQLGVAPWLAAELRPTPSLTLTPGLRFEPTLLETSRASTPHGDTPTPGYSRLAAAVEPRFSFEQRLSRGARLFGSVGRYHQAPDAFDLSARFGNPALGLASATHALLGESVTLPMRTRVEVSIFSKWLGDLAVPVGGVQAPERGRALVATGRGRAYGAQLFVRQAEVAGFSGWLSATLSRSERRDDDGSLRLSDYDSPLVLAASVVKQLGLYRFAARARFASGLPRTPVVGAYYDLSADRYQPELGAKNSVRLRDFFQLDLRFDRRFELGDTALELYVDLPNVTFRQNQEEWAYSSDFRQIGSIRGLPPMGLVGLTVER